MDPLNKCYVLVSNQYFYVDTFFIYLFRTNAFVQYLPTYLWLIPALNMQKIYNSQHEQGGPKNILLNIVYFIKP